MTIHQTAHFIVREDALETCQRAIKEFMDYVRENEPDTILYTSLQEKEDPNHFMHYFIFEDEVARDLHSNSDAVNRFTGILYPNLIVPVEFTKYNMLASTK